MMNGPKPVPASGHVKVGLGLWDEGLVRGRHNTVNCDTLPTSSPLAPTGLNPIVMIKIY